MLSRRELLASGVVGSMAGRVASSETGVSGPVAEEQAADRDGQREISRAVSSVESALRSSFLSSSLSFGAVATLRQQMEIFFRAGQKFPDFIDVGMRVFLEIYDWHIKHQQQLVVTRAADGRYLMQFMFTTLVLRGEQDQGYIGLPYDKG